MPPTKARKTKKTAMPPISVYVRNEEDPLFQQVDLIQKKLGLRSRSDVIRTAVAFFAKSIHEQLAAK
jgi:metal-responsive CopG/Arc/MetJ family transcriptional regulator